jgi:PAS domain S-box-containing protein
MSSVLSRPPRALAPSTNVPRLIFASALACLVVSRAIHAQAPAAGLSHSPAFGLDPAKKITQYMHETWKVDQGLPLSSVATMTQTSDGYLWIGTQLGLTRFDGQTFTTFTARNTPALKEAFASALFADRGGDLWIGSGVHGVARLHAGRISAFPESVPAPQIQCFFQDRQGTIWAGTRSGVAKFVNGRFLRLAGVEAEVQSFAEAADGTLLIGSTRGVLALHDGKISPWRSPIGPIKQPVGTMVRDHAGDLLIGLTGEIVRLSAARVTRYGAAQGVPRGSVSAIVEDHNGQLWIGTQGGGLARLHGGRFESYTQADGLLNDWVSSILEDHEGALWVGTSNGGLERFREPTFVTYGMKEGLAAEGLWSVAGDRDGSLFIVPEHQGFARFTNGHFITKFEKDGYPPGEGRSMLRASDGTLWIGSSRKVFRSRGNKFEMLSGVSLPEGTANVLFQERSGGIWIGGSLGLFRYTSGQMQSFTSEADVGSAQIWTMCEDGNGTLWFGTIGAGLVRYENGKFSRFTTKNGLSHDVIESLHASPEGLWVGTQTGGLDLVRGNRIIPMPVSQVSMIDLLSIQEDHSGRMWLSSSQGLFSIPKAELLEAADGRRTSVHIRRYDRFDGLLTTEFNASGMNSSWQSADGRLWYPNMKGLVVVDPNHIPTNRQPPPVHVERLLADGRDASLDGAREIAPGHGDLELHYTSTSLLVPSRISFKYKLEGYDKDWVDAGSRRTAYYTGIPAGDYQFKVIAANDDGVWNKSGTTLAIRMLPHIYETVWFRLLAALALAGVAAGMVALRTRHIRQRAKRLTALVDERTAELRTSEERYRGLFDANPQPVWVYDVESLDFLAVNQAAVNHYGYSRDEFFAMSVSDLQKAADTSTGEMSVSLELWRETLVHRHRTKTGEIIEVEIAEHEISFAGRPARLTVISDVTARRDLEERLRQAQKMEAVGQLAGGIAHDLNNVLTAVMAHVDLAVTTLPPDAVGLVDLTQAQSAAHRGASMIRKLLGFSRRERLVLKAIDLRLLTTELAATIRRMLPSHIEVSVTSSEDLPMVAADAGAVQQIVLNLATNARDAMTSGGELRIDLRRAVIDSDHVATHGWGTPGTYLRLTVTDTGTGMDASTLARIFEPYFSTKGEGHGSGLGMAMVYGLMKQHMGNVLVQSEPGVGTVVKLYFPASLARAATLVREQSAVPRRATETILLVEDEPGVRTAATRALTRQGYSVLAASDGREGLELWHQYADTIDLVLSDAIMPRMTGQALFASIGAERAGVRMLLMSGYAGDEVGESPERPDHGFLAKPWTVNELLTGVRQALANEAAVTRATAAVT